MSVKNKKLDKQLVERILEQGQKLRTSMVESILKIDPFSKETFNEKCYNTPRSSNDSILNEQIKEPDVADDLKVCDNLSLLEKHETVCDSSGKTVCSCSTCLAYSIKCLKCDLRRAQAKDVAVTIKDQKHMKELLEYGDCLKIHLHSIHLNNLGLKKVAHEGLQSYNETYILEYNIPKIFTAKSKKPLGKGTLENVSNCRICGRRTNDVISFKRTLIHNLTNLSSLDEGEQNIILTIKYKNSKKKTLQLLGLANFSMKSLLCTDNLNWSETLPIYLTEKSLIEIGRLKLTVQLGCGRIFFGKEFIEAVNFKYKSIPSENNIINHSSKNSTSKQIQTYKWDLVNQKCDCIYDDNKQNILSKHGLQKSQSSHRTAPLYTLKSSYFSNNKVPARLGEWEKKRPNIKQSVSVENQLLFGLIYISEAQYSNVVCDSYFVCQPFCQSEHTFSKIVYASGSPLYNFCQIVPLFYEDEMLENLRDNFMVIEFWQKQQISSRPFGIATVPLHQFYSAYRNSAVFPHLQKNKLPIIGTDWWEPINSTSNRSLIGQVHILTALGTREQITNLEIERGFKDDVVQAKFSAKSSSLLVKKDINKSIVRFNSLPSNKENLLLNYPIFNLSNKVDKAVQSDLVPAMEIQQDTASTTRTQEMLCSFLKHLEQKQRPVFMETSTNTDAPFPSAALSRGLDKEQNKTGLTVKKTADLLDTLQKAISLEPPSVKAINQSAGVRFEISVNNANQLPNRRKLKSNKRVKGKSPKQEDNVMPSTYVTFETMPGKSMQMTNVFPKSTTPQWNYKCEVNLPTDMITNSQKKLIFKVWKKSTNAVLQPNTQTDLVLGFAAVDLTVLKAGLPSIQGWFNIIDFSGKCNGQINIHVNPLENIQKIIGNTGSSMCDEEENDMKQLLPTETSSTESSSPLSRVLKRKFTELDEITQRLRLRLSEVVQEDLEESSDEVADEFEKDINNLCIEEDFDLINFEEEARLFNENYSNQKMVNKNNLLCLAEPNMENGSVQTSIDNEQKTKTTSSVDTKSISESSLDMELQKGKEKIDHLLEKLTLVTSESQTTSTCSSFKNSVCDGQEKCNNSTKLESSDGISSCTEHGILKVDCGSDTSVLSNFSIDNRPNPDGQGSSNEL